VLPGRQRRIGRGRALAKVPQRFHVEARERVLGPRVAVRGHHEDAARPGHGLRPSGQLGHPELVVEQHGRAMRGEDDRHAVLAGPVGGHRNTIVVALVAGIA
jgi:hypothetical protein